MLKDFVADPINYYKSLFATKEQTQAMKDGTEREALSYLIYGNHNGGLKFEEQKEGSFEVDGALITCHADIVQENGIVVDIKNSVRKDNELIKEYWYQLNAYAIAFNCKQAFLFVDTNEGNEMDYAKCRLVEIPLDKETFFKDIKHALELLNNLPYQIRDEAKSKDASYKLIHKIAKIKEQIAQLEAEQEKLEADLVPLMQNAYECVAGDYICTKTFRKDTKRKMQMISETWNGKYKPIISVKMNGDKNDK